MFVQWRPPDPWSYSYLLGLYLGDGCVVQHERAARLVITLDGLYPDIIDEAVAADQLAVPQQRVSVLRVRGSRALVIQSYGQSWDRVFPQAGPGCKHLRRIVPADWQREVVDRHPKQFLRGLIHSDGCRTVNRFKTKLPSGRVAEYEYPRYFFSNLSADIRALVSEYCERLGVRWTQSNHRNISVPHRDSVATLDAFIGPKT